MSKGKKIALIVSMVVVLVVAAVINVTLLTINNGDKPDEVVQTSFFQTSRLDRQTTRDYEIAELNQIISMEGDEYAEARQNALAKKQQIVDAMETELLLETLLKAQGYEEVLVTVNANSDQSSVIVSKEELAREDTVRIYNVIATQASISNEYVRVMSV
ncbi:MAG: SpoIIIAH-like family protein [Clostridia bacterium]|nr:SpoIIIAH-like family protein [Clostridia bacterium]